MLGTKKFAAPLIIAAFMLLAATGVACTQNPAVIGAATPTVTRALPTRTAVPKPTERATAQGIKATGNLVSANQVTLAFEMPGRVKKLNIKEGDKVKAGAILGVIDTSMLEAQAAQAQAALNAANATLDRTKQGPTADEVAIAKASLDSAKAAVGVAQAAYDRAGGASNPYMPMLPESLTLQQATNAYRAAVATYNSTVNHPTATELKLAQAQVEQAQAAYDLVKRTMATAQLVAPFDGTVVWLGAKVGELSAPSVPALTLADLSQMQVEVGIDENALGSIRVDQVVTITVDALNGKTLTGHVKKIGLLATSTGGFINIPIKIAVDPTSAPIAPGMSATVRFQEATP
jgi:HlyD family secretion protein